MNVAAGPELAAAVSNAGGLGVIGGLGYTWVATFHRLDEVQRDTQQNVSNGLLWTNLKLFWQTQTSSRGYQRFEIQP